MGIDIDDKDLMDDEIKEALSELSYHEEWMLETIFHHIQESFQQIILSLLAENEIEQDFNDDSHVLSSEFDENLQQQVCQLLCDQ